eukprot:scaffold113421_cov20-Tisochrysis_lutea.AAC.1
MLLTVCHQKLPSLLRTTPLLSTTVSYGGNSVNNRDYLSKQETVSNSQSHIRTSSTKPLWSFPHLHPSVLLSDSPQCLNASMPQCFNDTPCPRTTLPFSIPHLHLA